MSSFKPSGPFARQGQAKKQYSKSWTMDHLITIISIDPVAHKITAENHMGEKAVYQIDKSAFERGQRGGYSDKRAGNRIDQYMAKEFPVGHRVVAEKATKTVFKAEGGMPVYDTNWIHNATQQDPCKLFRAILTVTKKHDAERIGSVQRWDPVAYRAGNKEFVNYFMEALEADFKKYESGVKTPMRGFQLRAIKKDGNNVICFDSSKPFGFLKNEGDDGQVYYSPISKAVFIDYCKQYTKYLSKSYPNFKEEGCQVEIMTFTSYVASRDSASMTWKKDFEPICKMVNRVSKQSADDEEGYIGRNTGVEGILELTGDNDRVVNKQMVLEPRDIAQRIYCNNSLWDVRTMVKSADGLNVRLDESIKVDVIRDDQIVSMKEVEAEQNSFPNPVFPDTSTDTERDPFADIDEFDPFA